ncbi:circadian clock protein LdpA [Roseofilum halophilum]|uniref:circadian clock protein LdpA n=1 Tax=Roseofilum halophilum TaxID=3082942 RepID=UPI003D2F94E4
MTLNLPILATRPYLKRVTQLYPALNSIRDHRWFKLICGASYQHIPAIRNLTLAYTLAGADCIDVAADPAIVAVAQEAISAARRLQTQTWQRQLGQPGKDHDPLIMASLNDGEDPHFRKAEFDPSFCPSDCPRPCEKVCPAQAIQLAIHPDIGVIDQRCYGCGRCIPICPYNRIVTRSYISTPQTLVPELIEQGIDALEIHTQTSHYTDFKRLWQAIQPHVASLRLIAISCPDGDRLIDYLWSLHQLVQPLSCPVIWQLDGRPMSGDISSATTHRTIKLAQKVIESGFPGALQLAGGTNDYTVPKLRSLRLLGTKETNKLGSNSYPWNDPKSPIIGVAYGSYARVLLSPILEPLEPSESPTDQSSQGLAYPHLEDHPDLLWAGVKLAHTLVSQLKPLPS